MTIAELKKWVEEQITECEKDDDCYNDYNNGMSHVLYNVRNKLNALKEG